MLRLISVFPFVFWFGVLCEYLVDAVVDPGGGGGGGIGFRSESSHGGSLAANSPPTSGGASSAAVNSRGAASASCAMHSTTANEVIRVPNDIVGKREGDNRERTIRIRHI